MRISEATPITGPEPTLGQPPPDSLKAEVQAAVEAVRVANDSVNEVIDPEQSSAS